MSSGAKLDFDHVLVGQVDRSMEKFCLTSWMN